MMLRALYAFVNTIKQIIMPREYLFVKDSYYERMDRYIAVCE